MEETPIMEASEGDHPPVPALVLTYPIENYDKWKEIFDAGKKERENQNMIDLGSLVDYSNQRMVSVFLKTPNHEKGIEYAQSDELKKILIEMGALGEPKVMHMDILRMPEKTYNQRYRMMITHRVKDYAYWKEIFDRHEPERRDAGLELVGIGRSKDDETEISVMFAFDDMDSAKIFASSEQLKTAMEESGVTSEPVLTWFETHRQ